MKGFYQEIIVGKSWEMLKKVKKEIDFVLIGGWAVYLYTQALKSKDIDIIVDYNELGKLRESYDLYKNERLKKYEVKREGIDIDIYLPHFSEIGLPVEEIIKYGEKREGFLVPKAEILLITKQRAYESRQASIRGQKDRIDILALLFLTDFDIEFYKRTVEKYSLTDHLKSLKEILRTTKEVEELELNRHFFAKRKREILERIINFT